MNAYILPGVVGVILLVALWKRTPVFDAFLQGALGGLQACVRVLPSLIGLLTAVELCQASGVFSLLASFLTPVTGWLGIPSEVMPLFFLRPFSGGGSTALVDSVLHSSGPDSPAGLIASVMMGSSETTFYAISVYYGSIHRKADAGVWPAALLGDVMVLVGACLWYWFLL